jgi:hypothetical protein
MAERQPEPSIETASTIVEKEPTRDLPAEDDIAMGTKTDIEAQAGLSADEADGETDPDVVDWNGPDDPENPKNWPMSKKWLNVNVLSLLTIVT